ncbi:hypothetical protein P7C70_g6933, partial [Phenoliferia sp. Uapishka_3]
MKKEEKDLEVGIQLHILDQPPQRAAALTASENPAARLVFAVEDPNQSRSFGRAWRRLVGRFTNASTGSPSDGMANGSEGSASVAPFLTSTGAQRALQAEMDDEDYVVDQVVVDREEKDDRTGGSRTAHSQTDGSPDADTWAEVDSPKKCSTLATVWHAVVAFFDPKFEDVSPFSEGLSAPGKKPPQARF